ncbi:MAG: hypothetical protein II661_04205 [Bacteroidales bacterium]|nr:hypothetical protein [Bacteroidales bacterium]
MVRTQMKDNVSVSAGSTEWVSTSTLEEQYIRKNSENILNEPGLSIFREDGKEDYYTKEQMLEMFLCGFRARRLGAHSILRRMSVGEKTFLPYEAWNTARTAANQIEKNFGARFKVRKIGKHGERGVIEVHRTA